MIQSHLKGGDNAPLSSSGVESPLKPYRRLDSLFPTPLDYCVCRSCEPDETKLTPPLLLALVKTLHSGG